MKIPKLILLALLTAFAINSALADSTGAIIGKVVNATTALPPLDAKVTIVELNREVPVCPVDGKYFIQDIPPGIYSLKVECDYYETATIDSIEVDLNSLITQNTAKLSPIIGYFLKPRCYQFYTNDMKDARPIISLCWRLFYQHQNKTVGELISIYAR